MSGFDEREFTYDEYDDMVRDVRKYTSYLDLASPSAADGVVGDPSVRDLLEKIRATTTRDLGLNPASSLPSENPPVGHSPIASPGGVSPASPEGGTLQGQVEFLIRMVALVVERRLVLHLVVVLHRLVNVVVERRLVLHLVVVLHRVVDVVGAGVVHLEVDVVPLRHSALLPDQRRTNPTQGPSVTYDVLHSTRRGIFQTSSQDRLRFIR